jgi:CheY-like chemotaxis protein
VDAELTIELLKLIPSILWVVLVAVLIGVFYKPIVRELLPRVSGFKAFGVEVALVRQELDRAVEKQEAEVSQGDRAQFLTRAQRVAPIVQGAQILWVDDNPDNNIYERSILRSLGIFVDLARTSAEALSMLSQTQYDVVISDMSRDGVADEGLRFLAEMRERGLLRWTIFYIGRVDPERGVPAYAFGITDRPDHLLHLVFDSLERERG